MVEIDTFEVRAVKHPREANATDLAWKVLVYVRFREEDPRTWGEFRAYGGSWTRTINRTHKLRNIMLNRPPQPDPGLRSRPRRQEFDSQLVENPNLPYWGLNQGPEGEGAKWRLGNDQHVEIFYAAVVPGVPRSDPQSAKQLPDDDNEPDDPATARDRGDLAELGRTWHIIARDEPSHAPVQIGDFVEYWHRGEFQIREPQTRMVLPERRQIFLRVTGKYPTYEYLRYIDSTRVDLPAFWETSISSSDDPGQVYYPGRDMRIAKS